jgi:hypothetical protein
MPDNHLLGGDRDGERVPVPPWFARQVAEDAVRRAKAYGTRRHWTATRRLRPLWAQGQVGIRDPKKYLVYQDQGTQPYTPYNLEGKVVPIKNKRTGEVNFVRAKGVGTPGWTRLPGGVRVWKEQRWRRSGIPATHFMRKSLNEAIGENSHILSDRLKRIAKSGPHDYFVENL